MKKDVRIEGVHVDLDALKADAPKDLKKTEIFSHLPESKQDAAYQALQAELDTYEAKPETVTVEKGASVKNFTAEETKTKASSKKEEK
jgi:hypothetical protein